MTRLFIHLTQLPVPAPIIKISLLGNARSADLASKSQSSHLFVKLTQDDRKIVGRSSRDHWGTRVPRPPRSCLLLTNAHQAAGGIGQETAFAFAEAGARGVVLADINLQGAQEAAEKSKSYAKHPEFRALGMVVDVADPISVQAMVDAAIEDFGRIDYSVNSAGVRIFPTLEGQREYRQTDCNLDCKHILGPDSRSATRAV